MVRSSSDHEAVRITTASESRGVDIAHRQKRYIISMAIRTVCFVGAVFTTHVPWLCAILVIGALILPYVAVVMANSTSPADSGGPVEGPGEQPHKELR